MASHRALTIVVVVVVAAIGLAAGIDALRGGPAPEPGGQTESRTRMQATLTDDGCTYQGDTNPAAGRFTIEVMNQTQDGANFALLRLANGFTAVTIKPILAKETAWLRSLTETEIRDMEQGKPPLDHPRPNLPDVFDFRGGTVTSIGAGATTALPGVGVSAGSYALICRNVPQGAGEMGFWGHSAQYVAAQIDVTGVLPGVTTP